MVNNNGHITFPVSVYDVQRALGVSSGDVGTLCTHENINIWARYRPIPCAQGDYNNPTPITDAQRMAERYGIDPPYDMFTADDVATYENYANQLSKYGLYYIKLRPWGDTKWKRLTDFVKTNANGEGVANKGYDHKAEPDEVEVEISYTDTYKLVPLIPKDQHTIVIPPSSTNARYQFPNDHTWINEYFKKLRGETTTVTDIKQNDEWLNPMDFMGTNTYDGSFASVLRRIIVFRWEDSQRRIEGDQYYNANEARWHFYNYATDKAGGDSQNRPFDTYPTAWLDLTDSEQALNTATNLGQRRFKDLIGKCLFIDSWLQSNSSTNQFPILGFAYEVDVRRDSIDINVDIAGVIIFSKVEEADYSAQDGYVVRVSYDANSLGLNVGLVDAGVIVVPKLQELYDALTVTIGSTTINMLDVSLDYSTDSHGEGFMSNINCVVTAIQQSSLVGAYATITAIRKNTGVSSTKQIQITF